MDSRTAILAFLAGRSPAAYTEADIVRHVSGCGRLRVPLAGAHGELEYLASVSGGVLVECHYAGVSGDVVWYATPAGCARWRMDGQPYIP